MPPIRTHTQTGSDEIWALYDQFIQEQHKEQEERHDPVDYWWNRYCDNCRGHNTFVEDPIEGALICGRCGYIDGEHVCLPDAPNLPPNVKARTSRSAPYWPPYHANERIAAWYCMGPRVPPADVDKIRQYIENTPIVKFTSTGFRVDPRSLRRLNIMELNSFHFRQICATLKMREHSERWISLKQDLLGGPRVWQPRRPSPIQLLRFHKRFVLLVNAFNRTLYKKGKKRTSRDNSWATEHPLSRHNLPHYNEIFHYLFQMEDEYLREYIDADIYFPRVKTKGVQKKLRKMMKVLFKKLQWELPKLY